MAKNMWWWITAPACTSQMFFSWSRSGHPKTLKKHSIGRFGLSRQARIRRCICPWALVDGNLWESMGIHGNLWSMFNDVWWIRNRIMMSKMFKLLVGWWFVVGFMRLFDHIWSIVSCRGCSNVPTASVYNLSETLNGHHFGGLTQWRATQSRC